MARRYWMVVGTFLLTLLLYIDRICISVAKEPIVQDLNLSDEQMGWVLSVFALGYALFQTPAGILADRLGPRRVLTAVVTFWSLFTALTGAAWNFTSMLVVRLLFGAGEAGAFPGISRAVFSWIPLQERGLVTGINFSGSRLGAAFALPFVAWLILTLGWRMSFVVLGAIGVVWAVVWYLIFRDDPTEHSGLSVTEQDFIRANRQQVDPAVAKEPLRAGSLIGSKNMWLAMGQYFCSNFTFFFCLTWLFPHLKEKYALETLEAGFYASAPLVLGALGNWFGGWWIDRIYRQGNWTLSRRLPAVVGFGLAAIGLVVSVYMQTPLTAIIFLSIAIFGADMTLSPSWSFAVDIGRQHAGAVSGTMNMAGNIGAFITALAFPYMQSWTGSEVPFFFVGAGLNVVAIFLWLFMQPDKQLEEY
ncbi:MFS transporter [Tunicatimonas pelagia]|uniref:MFS transporter n=1 Tax=Tunicatimonas pelagia TaxID=931531 RepID=UPI0026669E47|nr:MFS transporter [Tunicatimonas pelagia]WKN46266.1 MFS transporter [Tunicatimonas pelagia]